MMKSIVGFGVVWVLGFNAARVLGHHVVLLSGGGFNVERKSGVGECILTVWAKARLHQRQPCATYRLTPCLTVELSLDNTIDPNFPPIALQPLPGGLS